MLYETLARAEEILEVNIEELDFAGRRCPVKAKGARTRARRRGQAREDYVLETGVLKRRPRPAPALPAEGPHPWAGVRHPPPPGTRQGAQCA